MGGPAELLFRDVPKGEVIPLLSDLNTKVCCNLYGGIKDGLD